MIGNNTRASEYRVRTLDRNDLNEKGKIYIGQGTTTTTIHESDDNEVNCENGKLFFNIEAKNIITAINENATDKTIKADTLSAQNGIASVQGDIVVGGHYDGNGVYLKDGSADAVIVGPSDPDNNSGLIVTKKGLYVNNSTNGANVVSIDNSGNIKAVGNISSTKGSIMVVDTDGTHLAEMDGNGHISSTNGNITAVNGVMTAQSFNAKSDKRLKENIETYSPKQSILDLPVYSYNFINDSNKTQHIGCLAQDLQKICPEIVREDDKGFLSIEENKLVYLLLDEVKKLKKRVDELEAK